MLERLLIVEDNWMVAEELRRKLVRAGFDVVGMAAAGRQAFEIAEEERPEVAIVDIDLQDNIDGTTVGELLAERGVAIIYLTAFVDLALRDARSHAVDVLGKPYRDAELFAALEKARSRLRH
jgi:two-component system, response regulator PdtaR